MSPFNSITNNQNDAQLSETSKNILVVDDEQIIRKICTYTLEKTGYTVLPAVNGVEALKQLAQHDVDMALIDLKMPLMNGMELLQTMRQDYPHIQVIVMTAYATVENAINAMKKGAYDFIIKPFKAGQLRVIVERCADTIKMNKEIRELKLANKRLREVKEMKDKFIAITSHELRTPVSHVKGYLTILNDDSYPQISEEERKEFMCVINSAVSDLERIVHNMYEVIRLEQGSLNLNYEVVDIIKLLKQVMSEFQLVLRKRKIQVGFETTVDDVVTTGDQLKMKQVFSELMQNAIKFTPDGGRVQIKVNVIDGYCNIKFMDSGVGFRESEKSKIFEKFYEIQNSDYHSTSKMDFMGGGIGLGLSIVKAIVEAHGGRIVAESIPNKGSKFTVRLPLTYNYNA